MFYLSIYSVKGYVATYPSVEAVTIATLPASLGAIFVEYFKPPVVKFMAALAFLPVIVVSLDNFPTFMASL